MEFLGVVGHAAGRDDLERLQRGAVHDHILRRPVGTGDGVPVLPTLHLGCLDRARLQADLDLRHRRRRVHPEVDQVDLGVAADGEEIASRSRQPRDVHGVARLENIRDLLRVAFNQGNLAGIAQGDREEVVQVELVHLLLRPLVGRHDDFPALLDLGQAVFRRLRRLVQQVARHEVDIGLGHVAGGAPVGHAGGRAVVDEGVQIVVAELAGEIGRQRFAGRAIAQDAVAAGAALEIDPLCLVELVLGEAGDARFRAGQLGAFVLQDVEAGLVALARLGLVFLEILRRGPLGRLGVQRQGDCRREHEPADGTKKSVSHDPTSRVGWLIDARRAVPGLP